VPDNYTRDDVRLILEQASDSMAPYDRWITGEEHDTVPGTYDDPGGPKNGVCALGALSLGLLGGWGVMDKETYHDFGTEAAYSAPLLDAAKRVCKALKELYPGVTRRLIDQANNEYKRRYADWLTTQHPATKKSYEEYLEAMGYEEYPENTEEWSVELVMSFIASFNDRLGRKRYVHSQIVDAFTKAIKDLLNEEFEELLEASKEEPEPEEEKEPVS
jgi:hypothetical protein